MAVVGLRYGMWDYSKSGASFPVSAEFFSCSIKHFTDSIYLSESSPTYTQRDSSPSISDPAWSKQDLFGLLGILFVIIVPCVGLLLKYCVLRRGWLRRWNLMGPGIIDTS
jgi:hypothetical protein